MKVSLIAQTQVTGWEDMRDTGYQFQQVGHSENLAEFAGRLCYEAYGRKNPATATNEGYLANIIEHKHFSVLEHSSATFLIEGVSRSLTHELVRHRHFSFSQVSQRYVDHSEREIVRPPAMNDLEWELVQDVHAMARDGYEAITQLMKERGVDKKTRNGAARAVLPEATSTSLVMTGNHRSWREFIDKRYSVFADAEIRELAERILGELRAIAPNMYQDFEVKEFGSNPVV